MRKTNGGVRGIVVGDVVRRLVARTVAQQLGPSVEAATAPYQYAISTRAGSECIAHVIQGLTELNPEATVLSIDGISAYDQISRAAMMDGLFGLCGGEVVPFVRLFSGSPSTCMWEDAEEVEHLIRQGEGGGHDDPVMLLLYPLGQHFALEATQEELRKDEVVCAFLDDIYVVTPDPHRIGPIYTTLQQHFRSHLHNVATAFVRVRSHPGPRWKDPSVEQGRDQAQRLRSIGAHRTVEKP